MRDRSIVPHLILQNESSLIRQEWSLDAPRMTIGRDEDNDIVLQDPKVSRRHAVLRLERGRWVIEDQGSRNGTFVGGKRLQDPSFLNDGEEIGIATKFRLLFVDPEVTHPSAFQSQAGHETTQTDEEGSEPTFESVEPSAKSGAPPSPYRLSIQQKARRVWVCGKELHPPLSASQYMILDLLFRRIGEVVGREEIAQTIWPKAAGIVSEQAIDSLVWRLRKRLAEIDPKGEYITTVRGHGIRLEEVFR